MPCLWKRGDVLWSGNSGLCHHFNTAAGCRFGNRCRFRHEPPATTTTTSNTTSNITKPGNGTNNQSAKWWHDLEDDDPITLEPLRTLSYEPFELRPDKATYKSALAPGNTRKYYFDGKVLAEYLISSSNFVHPVSIPPPQPSLNSLLRRAGGSLTVRIVRS